MSASTARRGPARIVSRLRAHMTRIRADLRTHAGVRRMLSLSMGPLLIAVLAVVVVGPIFTRLDRYGIHDWDSHAAYRHITTISLLRYGEAPLWNPYLCGGHTSWGYVEGSTNFISPYLVFYLMAPIRIALRLEVLGSALLLMTGIYLLAGRFTKSPALRCLAVALGALNGRWALQALAGHTWHLQYAWLPLALYFFDIAIVDGKRWYALWCGVVLAEMLYMGAIYPLPHTVLILVAYVVLFVIVNRTLRPVVALAIAGVSALGLSAPKLLPIVFAMMKSPRLIASTEQLSLGQLLTFFVVPHNDLLLPDPIRVPEWPWHEYGFYVGWGGVFVVFLAVALSGERRALVLKVLALLLLALSMGAFHDDAPWTLLHKLPLFSSQHVPSRFLYPGVMLLGVALAGALDGWSKRLSARFGLVAELALMIPVTCLALDIAFFGHKTMDRAFVKVIAPAIAFNPVFAQREEASQHYADKEFPEQGMPVLLPMLANEGVVHCYGLPDLAYRGAVGRGMPQYRGEVYVTGGSGTVRLVEWSPNKAVVEFWNVAPEASVVYNMNYDDGWRADGARAEQVDGAVGVRPIAPNGRVVFRYFPRSLVVGIAICAATLAAIGAAAYVRRRRRRAREPDFAAPTRV